MMKPRKPINTYETPLKDKGLSPPSRICAESTRLDGSPNFGMVGKKSYRLDESSLQATPVQEQSAERSSMMSERGSIKSPNSTSKSKRNSTNKSLKGSKEDAEENEEDDVEDQPSLEVIKSSTSGRVSKNTSSGYVSKSQLTALQKSPPSRTSKKPAPVETSWSTYILLALGLIAVSAAVIFQSELQDFVQQQTVASFARPSSEWKARRETLKRKLLNDLTAKFPNQPKTSFKTIHVALKSGMQPSPEQPGSVILVTSPEARATANCLLKNLVQVVAPLFSGSNISMDNVLINASRIQHSDQAKSDFHRRVEASLTKHNLAVIPGLEQLKGETAIALQGFADDSEAPFKNSGLLMTLEGEKEEGGDKSCDADTRATTLLKRYWKDLGTDKVTALISRVTVSVVEVVPEPDSTLKAACPNHI